MSSIRRRRAARAPRRACPAPPAGFASAAATTLAGIAARPHTALCSSAPRRGARRTHTSEARGNGGARRPGRCRRD
eukprot:scaffold98574_cov60-Phaeocystis_antarctica.AAC.5